MLSNEDDDGDDLKHNRAFFLQLCTPSFLFSLARRCSVVMPRVPVFFLEREGNVKNIFTGVNS